MLQHETITLYKVTNTRILCSATLEIMSQTRTIAESSIVHTESLTSALLSNIADGRKSLKPEVKGVYPARIYYLNPSFLTGYG